MSKARIAAAFALTLSVFGCSNATTRHGTGGNGPVTGASDGGAGGGGGGGGGGHTGGGGGGGTPSGNGPGGGPACNQGNPNSDQDMDGYTVAQGDCNDCDPNINPGAIDVPGDGKDNDCNGSIDDPQAACDKSATGKNDAQSIAQSIELCDPRFLKGEMLVTPSNDHARNVMTTFGVLTPHTGANMALLSTGLATDEKDVDKYGYVLPQDGTDFGQSGIANPLPALKGAANCGSTATTVNDYTEVVFTLKAPTNVQSFSFDFQFFSAEYPEFVCSSFNDEFLAIVESSKTYTTAANISFDSKNNPVTINSGFFTVCDGCATPITAINGTGYETKNVLTLNQAVGGSTGWLTTTAPIEPGEDITLRFVIFDESDGIYDSAVLLDNFKWGTTTVTGPVTGPITYRSIKKTVRHGAHESLMCGA